MPERHAPGEGRSWDTFAGDERVEKRLKRGVLVKIYQRNPKTGKRKLVEKYYRISPTPRANAAMSAGPISPTAANQNQKQP